jgi:hypothetical protein
MIRALCSSRLGLPPLQWVIARSRRKISYRNGAHRRTEQAAVRRIAELRTAGQSYRQIAATLDAEDLALRRAAAWSAMAVRNKRFSTSNSKDPSLLQGMAACADCGYGYYRTNLIHAAGTARSAQSRRDPTGRDPVAPVTMRPSA